MPPMGVPQYGGGGAQFGRGWIPGGRALRGTQVSTSKPTTV